MTKKDVYDLRIGCDSVTFNHPRVSHINNKNLRRAAQEIKDMEKDGLNPSKEYEEYQKKKTELQKKYANQNEDGSPRLKSIPDPTSANGQKIIYDIPGQNTTGSPYKIELDKLDKENKEYIDVQKERERKYNDEFLDDDTDFKPTMMDLSLLEDNGEKVPTPLMKLIHWMIIDPDPEPEKKKPAKKK